MRLLRIRLANYRGISAREVKFAPSGVTRVEGDNEVGKSSLIEAFDILIEHRDSTERADVKAIRPDGLDVPTEIEAEFLTGSYHLTYTKRFFRERGTTLVVHAPRRESHRGREAHDRMRQILADTLDEQLWRALRVAQGDALSGPDLAGQRSLAAALDSAARDDLGADHDSSVVDLARAEWDQYFTATGKRNRRLEERGAAAAAARAAAAALKERLDDCEADVDRHAELGASIASARSALAGADRRAREAAERVTAVAALAADVDQREEIARAVAENADAVAAELGSRRAMAERLAQIAANAAALRAALAEDAPRLDATRSAGVAARTRLSDARRERDAAVGLARTRRGDHDDLVAAERLEGARTELVRQDESRAAALAARTIVASILVDDEALAAVETAADAVLVSRARAEAERPNVLIESLADGVIGIEGEQIVLDAGATASRRVEGALTIEIPGSARIQVTPGTSAVSATEAVRQADAALGALLADLEVADLAAARAAHRRRSDALALLVRAEQSADPAISTDLRALVAELEARRSGYLAGRTPVPAPATDIVSAATLASDAEETAAESERAVETAERDLARVQVDADSLEMNARRAEAMLASADESAASELEALDALRAREPDEELAQRAASRADVSATRQREAAEARTRLRRARADEARAELAEAQRVARELNARVRSLHDEQKALEGRIQAHSEEGLHHKFAEAQAQAERARREHESWEARAAAADRLYRTLTDHRERAHRAYHAPLRARIEELGRSVFGPTFSVELDDELNITHRTLGHTTLEVAKLSAGAMEQLGLLTRLACASLVAHDQGGAPVILDDALGWSDPARLKQLGEVLGSFPQCQVIVLTCTPDRFANVATAGVVQLARSA